MASEAKVVIRPLPVASVLQKQLLITLLVLSGPISFALGGGEAEGNAKKGEKLFLEEFSGVQGNGRSCATCHVPADAFGLTPAHAEDRWQKLQQARETNPKADDPLFRAIDADDFNQDFTM